MRKELWLGMVSAISFSHLYCHNSISSTFPSFIRRQGLLLDSLLEDSSRPGIPARVSPVHSTGYSHRLRRGLPFSLKLPQADALPADTVLRGADLVYLDGHPAALLIFTIHRHEASVFVAQDGRLFAISPRSARSGFAMRSATAGGLRLMGVSDVNPADLDALMGALVKVQ